MRKRLLSALMAFALLIGSISNMGFSVKAENINDSITETKATESTTDDDEQLNFIKEKINSFLMLVGSLPTVDEIINQEYSEEQENNIKEVVINSIALREEIEIEQDELETETLNEIYSHYLEANSKLDSIINAKPEWTKKAENVSAPINNTAKAINAVATDGEDLLVDSSLVADENIEIHLFDYGPYINQKYGYSYNPTNTTLKNLGGGYLPFIHNEKTYGYAVDNSGSEYGLPSGNANTMKSTLENGYPYIETAESSNVLTGSLKYLFNKDDNFHINPTLYEANLYSDTQNPYLYQSVHFAINTNGTDSGTGLFQKENGYFVYDSAKNAAVYNKETNKFDLYNYILRPSYTAYGSDAANGNFLPFNIGHTQGREDYQSATETKKFTYTTSTGATSDELSTTVAKTDTVTTKPNDVADGTKPIAYRLFGNSRSNETNLWFGMTVEFDFYMTKDGKVRFTDADGNEVEQNMVFEFLGDDDVWVYIDDVLVLDIGGTHGALAGTIDFSNGAVKYTNQTNYKGGRNTNLRELFTEAKTSSGNVSLDKFKADSNTFEDYTRHNLKFFYLERGGNISYCKLKFNLDPLPKGSMSVTKQEENLNDNFKNIEEYTFKLTDENDVALAGKNYEVTDPQDSSKNRTGTTGEDGLFKLKNGQTATFTNMQVTNKFIVQEITDNTKYTTSVQVNGSTKKSSNATEILEIKDNEAQEILFTNTWKTEDLSLEKKIADGAVESNENALFDFEVKVNNEPYTGKAVLKNGNDETAIEIINGAVSLRQNEKIVINDIPLETSYSVMEKKPQGECFKYSYRNPLINGAENKFGEAKEFILSETTKDVVVTNRALVDLTIKKNVTGNMGDKNKAFAFPISFTKEGETFESTTIVSNKNGDSSVTLNADGFVINMKHNESVTFTVPYDTKYVVSETLDEKEGYTKTVSGNEQAILHESTTVTYTNNKEVATPTGIDINIKPILLLMLLLMSSAAFFVLRKVRR